MNVAEIHELRDYLIQVYHANRIKQQEEDQKYVDDSFNVEFLPTKSTVLKTGLGYKMVSAPAEHIITSNPQVFRDIIGKGEKQNERVVSELNRWARNLLRQTPQPYKEFVKKLLGRGEAWIYLFHNNDFKKNDPNSLPVNFRILDPLIVFEDGFGGEVNGVPERVLVCYERIATDIKRNYPDWTWKNRKGNSNKALYLMYVDKDYRYFEAAEEALLTDDKGQPYNGDGIQQNIYGFVNFVHSFSGFGEGAPDGDPSGLAVGRLTKVHDLLREYTGIKSALNTIIFKYAYPPLNYFYDPTLFKPPDDLADNYDTSLGSFNKVPITPGGDLKKGVDMLPDQELFQYLATIQRQIDEEDPLGTISQAIGTSGRQQDMAQQAGLRKYDTIVENCAHAFATAFGMGLQLLEKIPSIYPETLNKGDVAGSYECRLELKAEDPIERDRLAVLGERLDQMGIIDRRTNLTRYQGYTDEDATTIMNRRTVDDVIMTDPVIRRLIAIQTAREMGMEEQYTQLEAQLAEMEKGKSSVPQTGAKGGPPREGNIQTPQGMEMADLSLMKGGQRSMPA